MNAELPTEAAVNLARYKRWTWSIAAGCLVGAFTALAATSIVALPEGVAVVVAVFLVTVAFFFMVGAYRVRVARRGLNRGCREVLAVGWVRAPDGCNYAVFKCDDDPAKADPELVLRLPTRRRTMSSPALLCGSTRPSRWGAASLFSPDGRVLAVGRVRSQTSGHKVWRRRNAPTPWWTAGGGMNQPADI
jgi:hypothetical protein